MPVLDQARRSTEQDCSALIIGAHAADSGDDDGGPGDDGVDCDVAAGGDAVVWLSGLRRALSQWEWWVEPR